MKAAAKPTPSTYATEILLQAENLCQSSDSVRDARLLWIRGLIAVQDGYDDIAIACLKRAVGMRDAPSEAYVTLGTIFIDNQCPSESIAVCLLALMRHHYEIAIYRLLARALQLVDQESASELVLLEASSMYPRSVELHCDVAALCLDMSNSERAESRYRLALSLNPRERRALTGIARVRLAQDNCEAALDILEEGIKKGATETVTLAGEAQEETALCLVDALVRTQRLDEAVSLLRNLLTHRPGDIAICRRLVELLIRVGRADDVHATQVQIGTLLQRAYAHVDAIAEFRQALLYKADSLQALGGLAMSYLGIGEPRKSLPIVETVLAADPHHTQMHLNLAHALYFMGDEERAWHELGWRYRSENAHRPRWEQPMWEGAPLKGKTILLWTEQGRGDAVQFLRYIPYVRSQGGRVLVQCHFDGLLPFLERMPAVEQILASNAPVPDFDVHAPLVYLPSVLERRPEIPGVPYLATDTRLGEYWRQRLRPDGRFTVGLSWGGNIDHVTAETRFIPLMALAPLAAVRGVRFISLQHGPQTAELLSMPAGWVVDSVLDFDSSIDDVAALMMNIDLVISVDTMTAHLAGALARPTWTLLRLATNWRWKLEGDRTPWYPTMRLFRQPKAGDWRSVVDAVVSALAECQVANQAT